MSVLIPAIRQTTIGRAMCLFILITGLGVGVEHVNADQPIWLKTPSNKTILQNEELRLSCQLNITESNPLPRWYFQINTKTDPVYVSRGAKVKTIAEDYCNIVGDSDGEYSLLIKSAIMSRDEGIWQCSQIQADPQSQYATVIVVVPVIDVTINRSGDLSIGEIYTLTCMATYGKPAASFRWYRNGSIVFKEDNRSNNKMENDTFTSKSVYNFKVRDEDDGSIVVCEAVQPLITTGKSDSVILTIDIYSNITEITTRNNKVWMVITIVIGVMFVASVIVGWKLFKKYKSQPTPSGQYDMVPRSSPEQTTTSIPHVAISQPSTSGSHTMTSDKTK